MKCPKCEADCKIQTAKKTGRKYIKCTCGHYRQISKAALAQMNAPPPPAPEPPSPPMPEPDPPQPAPEGEKKSGGYFDVFGE